MPRAVTVKQRNVELKPVARRAQSLHRGPMKTEKATFGAGCFWGVEETFRKLEGVKLTTVGYAGGMQQNPTYEDVGTNATGHAEVLEIEFDPAQITYNELLDVFWSNHNPTTLNRQGADVGTQYRSVIFYHSPEQKAAAEQCLAELKAEGAWDKPIVTQIEPLTAFYRAEEYHQGYFRNNPGQGYCQAVVSPKVSKFQKQFAARLA